MKIRIFITGGTFDKEYNELSGELFFKESHVPEMLKMGRCRLDIDIKMLMMIDSLNMTNSYRQIILQNCQQTTEDKILITHGTDTMVETARVLGEGGGLANKTIVLIGAMVPHKFGNSDGLFNLGVALAFVQILPPGIYIAMNGKHFVWDNVRKDKLAGDFEQLKLDS